MKFVFRVDASNSIGTGHLMRCLTLAEALHARGGDVRFICRERSGNLKEVLQQQTMPVALLPESGQTAQETHSDNYIASLGTTKSEDARQTIKTLQDDRPDWLVIDHYGLDAEWENILRPHVANIMVIDDLANRPHDCDVLLDQSLTKNGEGRYTGLVPIACKQLLGPSYAMLRPEYAAYRMNVQPRKGDVRRVMVFFGGSDRYNMTALALEALSASDFDSLEVDVVIGANYQQREAIERKASARPGTKLYEPRPHLADLMAIADLSIGAGGATTWERMCLGLPSMVIMLSENQIPTSNLLARLGLIRLIGHADGVGAGEIRESLLDEIKTRQYMLRSRKGMEICDGTGTLRVADALLS